MIELIKVEQIKQFDHYIFIEKSQLSTKDIVVSVDFDRGEITSEWSVYDFRKRIFFKSTWTINIIIFVLSLIIGSLLYIGFFMNLLSRFFANTENIKKNILAVTIIVLSVYTLLKIVINRDTMFDRYLLLGLYIIVLILGLLRPDQQHFSGTGIYDWNPFGFIFDIQGDTASLIVMTINLIIFMPMYFLLVHTNVLKTFKTRLIAFEIFQF